MSKEAHYLGDGAYASYDGFQITVSTLRGTVEHYVCLEPEVFNQLMEYAKKIGWLKKPGEWDA